MSDEDDIIDAPQDAAEESAPDNSFLDILTSSKESVSPKSRVLSGARP